MLATGMLQSIVYYVDSIDVSCIYEATGTGV